MIALQIDLPYGDESLTLELPDEQIIALLEPRMAVEGTDEEHVVKRALAHIPDLNSEANPLFLLPDITRPFPHRLAVELILARYDWEPEQVTLLFAGGNHGAHISEEHIRMVGHELAGACQILDHDAFATDLVEIGATSRGTPVQLNPHYIDADLRIACGLVEYHPFAGYSGGYKAIMPGAASQATIETNHRLALEPGAVIGSLNGNPVAADVREAGKLAPPTLGLNVTRDGAGRVDFAAAGDLAATQRACIGAYEKTHQLAVPTLADTVIVSAGGFPRDIDWRQASKALDFAARACRPEGTIICLAACPKGLGDPRLDRFMRTGWPDLLEQQRRNFELGSQRATHILEVAASHRVLLVTDMDPAAFEGTPIEPLPTLDEALESAGKLGMVTVMRYGSVLPYLA